MFLDIVDPHSKFVGQFRNHNTPLTYGFFFFFFGWGGGFFFFFVAFFISQPPTLVAPSLSQAFSTALLPAGAQGLTPWLSWFFSLRSFFRSGGRTRKIQVEYGGGSVSLNFPLADNPFFLTTSALGHQRGSQRDDSFFSVAAYLKLARLEEPNPFSGHFPPWTLAPLDWKTGASGGYSPLVVRSVAVTVANSSSAACTFFMAISPE